MFFGKILKNDVILKSQEFPVSVVCFTNAVLVAGIQIQLILTKLQQKKKQHATFQIYVAQQDKAEFYIKGTGQLHLTGYYQLSTQDLDQQFDQQQLLSQEEEVEVNPKIVTPLPKKENKPSKTQAQGSQKIQQKKVQGNVGKNVSKPGAVLGELVKKQGQIKKKEKNDQNQDDQDEDDNDDLQELQDQDDEEDLQIDDQLDDQQDQQEPQVHKIKPENLNKPLAGNQNQQQGKNKFWQQNKINKNKQFKQGQQHQGNQGFKQGQQFQKQHYQGNQQGGFHKGGFHGANQGENKFNKHMNKGKFGQGGQGHGQGGKRNKNKFKNFNKK